MAIVERSISDIRVSIIIPVYNGSKYIERCLFSILMQSHKALTVIVVDDGSTDDSLEKVKSFTGLDIVVFKQDNSGACAARNLGLLNCRSSYVKFLDVDDELAVDCISIELALSESLPKDHIVYGNYLACVGDKCSLVNTRFQSVDDLTGLLMHDILTSTPLHRLELLTSIDGFDEKFANGQEWNLHVRLASVGCKFHHSDHISYKYNKSSDPTRISIKKTLDPLAQALIEFSKVELTHTSIRNSLTDSSCEALAYRYWIVSRQLARHLGNAEANRALLIAKELSPTGYMRYWPRWYKLIFPLLSPKSIEGILSVLGRAKIYFTKYNQKK